ncbi:hypothetical protein CWM66_27215 [Kosakonia sp. H7A]|uniref:RNase A-like domain-containing protein n=1 Tax=Kosakonia TaxID=1330547 RepID=UPI000D162407|nr:MULTISPECIES: RNase A-like domain-containing protein [Kosakonia]PTA87237.1 hypothetical protein CWM66_27215 [Kosakonia sp. H7A]UDJ82125.1 hypothetical protein I5186_23880 [Kosakonia oryzae]VVT54124.1 Orf24 [Kosakonia radicincitans]
MDNEYGLRVAMSPVQMAAVLSDRSISEGETLSNRLYGGLGLAGGVVEMLGAGALCIVPEPTMITKAGCVIVGTHSLDAIQASVRQIWTGRQTTTDTYNSAVALAESLGADKDTAMKVGMTVDLAIPVGFAIAAGAVRVAAIRGGRIRLAEHESLSGRTPGGHTLERHIGKTPEELFERLERRPTLTATSSFRNVREAEQLISKVIADNRNQIQMWVKHLPPGMNAKMELESLFSGQTGILVSRGSAQVTACYRVRVILRFEYWHDKPYFVLTAFPKA